MIVGNQKRKPIRFPDWLKAARGEHCTMQVPGVCNHDPTTVVAAHSNKHVHGKGMGRKADDLFIAFACSACHQAYDESLGYEPAFLHSCWQEGHARTLIRLHERGLLEG